MGNRRIILELDREPQDLQAVWRLDSIARLIQQALTSGKYRDPIAVIRAAIELLEQQEDSYKGKLGQLQQAAKVGWEASQRGEVVDSKIAMAQIRANLQSRHT